MAEMVLTPPLRADGREPNFLQKFGHAFVHGDIFTKLSLVVWGLGYIGHGQLIKALLVTLVQGPALVTDFVKNVNNFNVIYLLTQDVYITKDQALASSSAKEVDLLVTWLFRLTQEQYNYKMAAVIGIMVFIICAVFTLVCFRFLNKKEATFS